MIIIYNKESHKILHTIWGDEIPNRIELGSNEAYENIDVEKYGIDPHRLHCYKLTISPAREIIEIHEPIYGNPSGLGILKEWKIIGYKKHKIKQKIVIEDENEQD